MIFSSCRSCVDWLIPGFTTLLPPPSRRRISGANALLELGRGRCRPPCRRTPSHEQCQRLSPVHRTLCMRGPRCRGSAPHCDREISTPIPRCRSPATIVWMSCTAIGSTPANGSSSIMNFGSVTRARVISSRRRSPPDSEYALFFLQSLDAQLVEELFQPLVPLAPLNIGNVSRIGHDVVFDGQLPEYRGLLRQVADAEPAPARTSACWRCPSRRR